MIQTCIKIVNINIFLAIIGNHTEAFWTSKYRVYSEGRREKTADEIWVCTGWTRFHWYGNKFNNFRPIKSNRSSETTGKNLPVNTASCYDWDLFAIFRKPKIIYVWYNVVHSSHEMYRVKDHHSRLRRLPYPQGRISESCRKRCIAIKALCPVRNKYRYTHFAPNLSVAFLNIMPQFDFIIGHKHCF